LKKDASSKKDVGSKKAASTKTAPRTSAERAGAGRAASEGFTAEERAAMRERAREVKAQARGAKDEGAGEREVLAKIAEMAAPDRAMAERLHAIVRTHAPSLAPRTWYGMPAYARAGKDGKVVCFFQGAAKFKTRYSALGFNDAANLDEGAMWPVTFALTALGGDEEAKIAALVRKAVR
jgi:uncharacterized protein YdhG (YjbR/CyaY superfamily)